MFSTFALCVLTVCAYVLVFSGSARRRILGAIVGFPHRDSMAGRERGEIKTFYGRLPCAAPAQTGGLQFGQGDDNWEYQDADSKLNELKRLISAAKAAISASCENRRIALDGLEAIQHLAEAEDFAGKAQDTLSKQDWSGAAAIADDGIFFARLARSAAQHPARAGSRACAV